MVEGMIFKARAPKDIREVNKKKGVNPAVDEQSESAATRKAERTPNSKKKIANKNNMHAAAVAMAKKSNLTGNPGAKGAALNRVRKGK